MHDNVLSAKITGKKVNDLKLETIVVSLLMGKWTHVKLWLLFLMEQVIVVKLVAEKDKDTLVKSLGISKIYSCFMLLIGILMKNNMFKRQ